MSAPRWTLALRPQPANDGPRQAHTWEEEEEPADFAPVWNVTDAMGTFQILAHSRGEAIRIASVVALRDFYVSPAPVR